MNKDPFTLVIEARNGNVRRYGFKTLAKAMIDYREELRWETTRRAVIYDQNHKVVVSEEGWFWF